MPSCILSPPFVTAHHVNYQAPIQPIQRNPAKLSWYSLPHRRRRHFFSTSTTPDSATTRDAKSIDARETKVESEPSQTIKRNIGIVGAEENHATTDLDKESSSPISKSTWETFHRLVNFAQPEHSLIVASAATLLVTSSTTLILPMASGHVLDLILSGDSTTAPPLVAAGLFGLTTVAGAGVYARTLWLQQAGNTLVARLKERLFRSIVYQDLAYLEQDTTTGDLLTRLSHDTTLIQSAVTTQAVAALRGIVMTVGSAVLLWHTSPTLAAVSVATLPPLFVGARLAGQRLREQQRQVQTLHSAATTVAEQALQGIVTVIQFGAQNQEWQRYQTAVNAAHEQAIRTGKIQALLEGSVHVAANGAVLLVLGYGGSMVVAGTLSVGDLTSFLMYSLLLAGNVSGLSSTYAEVSKAVAAADRVWQVMDRTPAIPSSFSSSSSSDTRATRNDQMQHPLSIEFRNVQFSYPTRREKNILGPQFSLVVKPGEVLSIVGESGSGKSTLAKLLTRLYDVANNNSEDSNGGCDRNSAILINNVDIRDWEVQELRQDVIGIVSQEPWLLDGTLAENIRYGRPTATDQEVRKAATLANVWSFASGFPKGLDTPVGSRGGTQLSGGQRQRVAIARLLLKDPPIVILDEATSALDASSEDLVQKALDSVMKGRTVISIAHRLSTIRNADRIAVLHNGRVVEVGTFNELSQNEGGAFRALMGRQLV